MKRIFAIILSLSCIQYSFAQASYYCAIASYSNVTQTLNSMKCDTTKPFTLTLRTPTPVPVEYLICCVR